MRMVSSSGSMLSCNTPILKGIPIVSISLRSRFARAAARGFLGGIAPGMLQTLYQLPERAIERRGDPEFFAAVSNGTIHEIHFGLALGENVLQHAGFVLARSVGALLHEGAGIAVELDAERFGDRFSFGDERVEERASGRESTGCPVVEQGESADGIGGGVEDELGPLRAAGVLQRNDFQACAVQKLR